MKESMTFGYMNPGAWSDDSSMALCLAESLVLKQGLDWHDAAFRWCRWYKQGTLDY